MNGLCHACELLAEALDARHMSVDQLAIQSGLPKAAIERVLLGGVVDQEVALRLEAVLEVPARFWLSLGLTS